MDRVLCLQEKRNDFGRLRQNGGFYGKYAGGSQNEEKTRRPKFGEVRTQGSVWT